MQKKRRGGGGGGITKTRGGGVKKEAGGAWKKGKKWAEKAPIDSTFEEPRLIYNGQRCGGIRHQYHADARPRGQLSCWTKATGVYTTIPHVARVYAARVAHGSLRS